MSRTTDHIARWQHNRSFMASLNDEHADWMVTSAFYAAVHAIGAVFSSDGVQPPPDHTNRFRVLKTTNRYKNLYLKYSPLFDASLVSRYHCDPSDWVDAVAVRTNIIPRYLFPLEKSVSKLLGSQAPELPHLSL